MYEIFAKLLRSKNVRASDVSKATGIPASTFTDWKNGRSTPKQEKLQKIADYFEVPLEYLINGEQKPSLSEKEEKDIQKKLNAILNQLDNDTGLMFDGQVVDEETKEKLRISLEMVMRGARKEAKEKFTPKKYKK